MSPRFIYEIAPALQKGGDDWVGFWGEQPIWLPTLLQRVFFCTDPAAMDYAVKNKQ